MDSRANVNRGTVHGVFRRDWSKLLITLATGVIAITITFSEKFGVKLGWFGKSCLAISWLVFGISIAFGVMHLMTLTGNLVPTDAFKDPVVAIGDNARRVAKVQAVSFIVALALFIPYGAAMLRRIGQGEAAK